MKFGKNLEKLVDVSDPEWGPYWINYKHLKKRVNDIVTEKTKGEAENGAIVKSTAEVEFFRMLRSELKKTSEFFAATEQVYLLRNKRVQEAFAMLQQSRNVADKGWTRLLNACVKFYKDVLLLENFAIMNYCGFSKILKKHDKLTGFVTRDAFMRNVMSQQNFTHATTVIELLRNSEKLFTELQQMEKWVYSLLLISFLSLSPPK
jgi:SPX domain protein involved in polyphosphate accumulation